MLNFKLKLLSLKLNIVAEGSSEETIAILRDRWWPQMAKQNGDRISKVFFLCDTWKQRNERPKSSEVYLLGVETVLRLGRDAWSLFKRLRRATNEYAPLNVMVIELDHIVRDGEP